MVRVHFGSAPPGSPDSTESLNPMTPKKRRPKCPAAVIPVDDLYVVLEYQANEQIIQHAIRLQYFNYIYSISSFVLVFQLLPSLPNTKGML